MVVVVTDDDDDDDDNNDNLTNVETENLQECQRLKHRPDLI